MNPARFVSRLTRKSRSNFFYAFLCLPKPQREALYAVYAFCRIVDDAVDVGEDQAAKRKELDRWRAEIAQVFEGSPEHPAAQRQRVWNAMMARIVAAGARVCDVPPPPDYSTPQACTDRALERGTRSPWYLAFVRISRQNGRPYRDFRRAVERAGGTLALPFPVATPARHARKAVAA